VALTWEQEVLSYENFICQDNDDARHLFKMLWDRAREQQHPHATRFVPEGEKRQVQVAYGHPRLADITISKKPKIDDYGRIHTTGEIVQKGKDGNVLIFTHVLDVSELSKEGRQRILSGKKIRVFATPKVNYTRNQEEFDKFKKGKKAFAKIVWVIKGEHQIQVIHPGKKLAQVPPPPRGRQPILV
jgi:hypothetical protein